MKSYLLKIDPEWETGVTLFLKNNKISYQKGYEKHTVVYKFKYNNPDVLVQLGIQMAVSMGYCPDHYKFSNHGRKRNRPF